MYATPTYAITLDTATSSLRPAYYVMDAMNIPENGFLTRVSVNIAATTGAAGPLAEAFPLTFRVLLNEHPKPQLSSGTRQFKAKNPGTIILVSDNSNSGDSGRRSNNVGVQVAKNDVLYFFFETNEQNVSGPVTLTLQWNLNFKFLQRKGPDA